MANVRQIPSHKRSLVRQDGRVVTTVYGSSGAEYSVTTDGNGVISCSCMAWRNIPLAIEYRVCKHLADLLDLAQTTGSAKKKPSAAPRRSQTKTDATTTKLLEVLGVRGDDPNIRDALRGVKSPVNDLLELLDRQKGGKKDRPAVRDADTSEADMNNLLNEGLNNKPKKRQIELDD